MIPALLLWFAVAPERVPVLGERLTVPANDWRAIEFTLQQRPAMVDCTFRVIQGKSGVRLELMPRDELETFQAGQPPHVLMSTKRERSGSLRYRPADSGEYALVVDNSEGDRAVEVELDVSLDFGVPVRTLSTGRRATIVLVTLTLFGIVVFLAGRRVIRSTVRSNPR